MGGGAGGRCFFNEVGIAVIKSLLHITHPQHTLRNKELLASVLVKAPYQGRMVSSLVGWILLSGSQVEADLAFHESLCAYKFCGPKLALLAFYLTTFASSWPALKRLLAMAFFLQHTEAVGRTAAILAPALYSPPRGASVTLGICRTLFESL